MSHIARSVYPAFLLFGVGMLLLSVASSNITLLLAGALIGLGFGNISSVSQTIAVNMVAPHRMGLATATFFIFFDLGNGFGPTILGSLISIIGFNKLYAILGFFVFAVSVLYYFLHGKKVAKNSVHTP